MPVPGGIAQTFGTLMGSTDRCFMQNPDEIVNDAVRRNNTLSHFWRGDLKTESVREGHTLRERVLLKFAPNFQKASSSTRWQWQRRDTGTNLETGWSSYGSYIDWRDEEKEFGEAAKYNKAARNKSLVDLKKQKEQVGFTDHMHGLDDLFWATPDKTTMEDRLTGEDPSCFSIPALINEFPNGLTLDPTGNGTWTTKMGINPVEFPEWVNHQTEYATGASITSASTGLIAALNKACRRVNYTVGQLPGEASKHFEKDVAMRNPFRVFTSPNGVDQFQQAMFAVGDYLSARGNGVDGKFAQARFDGTALIEIQRLEEVEIFPGAGVTLKIESEAARPFPRYWIINTDYMKFLRHGEWFFRKHSIKEPTDYVGAYYMPVISWVQLWVNSMRRHAVVSPAAAE